VSPFSFPRFAFTIKTYTERPVVNRLFTSITLPFASFAFVMQKVARMDTMAVHTNASDAKRPGPERHVGESMNHGRRGVFSQMRRPSPKMGFADMGGPSLSVPLSDKNLSGLNSSTSVKSFSSRPIALCHGESFVNAEKRMGGDASALTKR